MHRKLIRPTPEGRVACFFLSNRDAAKVAAGAESNGTHHSAAGRQRAKCLQSERERAREKKDRERKKDREEAAAATGKSKP